jgi:hypothetical protein
MAIAFGLLLGSLTTYFKKKGTDAKWYNWAITGFAYGASAFPIAWNTGRWAGFSIRCVVLSVSTSLWSQWMNNVVWEECGRGALIILTLPLLLF